MRKTLNLQASALTDEAKAYMLAGGADSLVLWAPQWGKPEPAWEVLDANVKWAHGKLETFIAVPSAVDPSLPPGWGPETVALWPGYLKLILERYPHTTIIVQNEPDYAGVPAVICARLMRTAAEVAHAAGHTRILGPATATALYALKVLSHLHGWKPPLEVGYAHHQYIDVGRGSTWHAQAVLSGMEAARWRGRLWLTEGGYIYPTVQDPNPDWGADPTTWHYRQPLAVQEQHQLERTVKHYRWAQDNGRVEMWAGYEYVDSMWGGWASGLKAYDGTPHPLHDVWPTI